MVNNKSLDDSYTIIAALLHDVQNVHGDVFNTHNLKCTCLQVRKRLFAEGMGFLTKALPRLGKAFDKAISGNTPLDCTSLGFSSIRGTKLPRFLGEFFSRVLQPDGALLEQPCAQCVRTIRQVLYLFYKYELPYSDEQEQQVIQKFVKTEDDLSALHPVLQALEQSVANSYLSRRRPHCEDPTMVQITREAKILLSNIFSSFDPRNIHPRHGPGVVATKQSPWSKYVWTNISRNITTYYPADAYFFASMGHVCDEQRGLQGLSDEDLPARVLLVPKDSRGPRLISCEPVDYQWVQQGLGRAIVELVEHHPDTCVKDSCPRCALRTAVHFTNQEFNRIGALVGSLSGEYVTLDLNEASDRISLDLVRLLYPEHVYTALSACRSSSTVLPNGSILKLKKFAPMGSSLCFPILALTVWAILYSAAPNEDTKDGILVYGDDVIVPKAYASNAMKHLESFGLKINRDKSCTSGLFRESCGMDAFKGVDVTPVRLRTVWKSTPSPDVYTSWIAYANSMFDRRYYRTYDAIVGRLHSVYGSIPSQDMHLACPSLRAVPESDKPRRKRWNKNLQKFEYHVLTSVSRTVNKDIPGWSKLLRFFSEAGSDLPFVPSVRPEKSSSPLQEKAPLSVSSYTIRGKNKLQKRWITVQ